MTLQRRSYTSLPPYLQTDRNNLELNVTDDLLYEPEQAQFVSGFIGDTSKLSSTDLTRTPKLIENSAIRQKYQFTIGVAERDPDTQTFISGAFYDDLLNHLSLNGAIVDDPNRLFSAFYYAWAPPIDYDKIVNPSRYFWTGAGNANSNGEYVTKEAAGSRVVLHRFNGTSLVANLVTPVDGLPGSGTTGQIVEDSSTPQRFLYQWTGTAWGLMNFVAAEDTTIKSSYFPNDNIYVCRTGFQFNRPVVWVYRPKIGRWISISVVINLHQPEAPEVGMIWEDVTVPPERTLRIWDGNQWLILDNGTLDPFTGEAITYIAGLGPSGIPTSVTYLCDTRTVSQVDTWSAQNWWRTLNDLSLSDQGALPQHSQGARPIVEFWGNIETASGDTRTSRNKFPLFNLYAVSTTNFDVEKLNTTNFPGLDTAPLTLTGNFIAGTVCSTIFQYAKSGGIADAILGFHYDFGADGSPLFLLDLERLPITRSGSPLLGYRYFRDTATNYVHSIWERTGDLLLQKADGNGLFEIPKNLKFNPDHIVTTSVSRSNYINHFASVMDSQVDFSGSPYGANNYRFSEKNLTLNATMIDPEESLQRVLAVLQTNKLDIPDAIRQMARDYNKVMARFITQLNNYWNDGTLSTVNDTLTVTATHAVDAILTQIFMNRNSEFPYFYSVMGTYIETRIINHTVNIFDTTPLSIFIPNSAAQIGASAPYVPEIFTDDDGISKIRGHDGSLIPAFGDERDTVVLNLETRFYNSVPDYLKVETTIFSSRFATTFHLDDYYGNFIPNLTAGRVVNIVADYTTIVSPVVNARHYSSNQQVYATWDGSRWLLLDAQVNDVFLNLADGKFYIFNGFYAKQIVTFNRNFIFDYSENEYRSVIQREFERWIVLHNLDFTTNNGFDENDPFTWNFSSAGVEGNWRGLYRRIYRTIRPHSHPWEVVGYPVRPSWWFTSYVPTSFATDGSPRYTNSHPMWVDFQNGVVNPLSGLTFASHAMIGPIPVAVNGELLDPIAAAVIDEQALTPSSLADDWAYGDGGPVEQKFYDSYYFQFAVALAGYLMKTSQFVDRTWSEFYRAIGTTGANQIWNAPHVVFNNTLTRPPAATVNSQLSLDKSGNTVQNPGLNAWIAEYTNIIGFSANVDFDKVIKNTQAALGWKTSGFVNAKRTRVELLNGNEIPAEDINVVLHQGPSVNEYFQSGIIVVRDIDGFRVFGTDVLNPFFTVDLGAKPIAGGQIELLESFTYDGSKIHPENAPNLAFTRDSITVSQITIPPVTNDTATFSVLINGFRVPDKYVLRIDQTHFGLDQVLKLTAGDSIVASVITTVSNPSTQLGSFTVNGVQITYFATGTGQLVNYPYGHLFETLSDVVNMLIGYGRFLSSQGWIFERLTNGSLRDWLGASQTFALWSTDLTNRTRGNPTLMKGQIFQYSVMGRHAEFNAPFGMILGIEDIRNGSYGIVDVNGQPIRANHLNVVSTGGDMVVTSDTTDIFGLRLYLSEVQHVVFFPNTTTFADVIYEPAFGLAQDTVIVDTYRTTNWTGRMEAPGFLISGGNLLPNWEKKVNDITRYYNRFNPPDDPILTGMARALFGYIPQSYMNELDIDDRNQFNFFHGSLKSKGTFQPYEAFIRGTIIGTDNVKISEDWAWKFARYGDRRKVVVLFGVNEIDFVDVFQAIHFDELSFSYSFTGDGHTACFSIPQRFVPAAAVVTMNGNLQIFGIDYAMNPTLDGYEVCFTVVPLHGAAIVISLNDTLVHAHPITFYNPSVGSSIQLPVGVHDGTILLAVNGHLAAAPTSYSTFLNTIFFTPGGVPAYGLVFGDLGKDIFRQTSYTGDGFTTIFATGISGQSLNTVLVTVNGLLKAPSTDYHIDNSGPRSLVVLNATPNLNDPVVVMAINDPVLVRSKFQTFTGNGTQTFFTIPGTTIANYRQVLVSLDGLVQVGAIPGQVVPNTFAVQNGGVHFSTPPVAGHVVNLYVFLDAVIDQTQALEDDRVIHIPQFSPPHDDGRWVIPPQQDIYRDLPYRFPVDRNGHLDFKKYLFTASLVDQNAKEAAITMFHWDPVRGLHEPLALSLVDYKISFDPARYNNGPLAEAANGLVWGDQQVGHVWWDISPLVYNDYESYLPDYMEVTRQWGKLKYFKASIVRDNDTVTVTTIDPKTGVNTNHGLIANEVVVISGADQPTYNGPISVTVASPTTFTFIVNEPADSPGTGSIIVQIGLVNCYEWVASPVPPVAWDVFVTAQIKTGFNLYSGQVLNKNNPSYVTREIWDTNGNSSTTYYFWVQNNTRVIPSKDISVNDIAGRLRDPAQYEVPYFGIIDPATMFVFTGDTVVLDNAAVEITYYWYELPQHIEWILFGEGDDFEHIPLLVSDKLLDSMLGTDSHGNPVPNLTLAPDEQFGTCFFPAQIVFQNVPQAILIYLDSVNGFLQGIDINNVFSLFNSLALVDEKTDMQPDGYWEKTIWWDPNVNHSFIYDTVVSNAELTFRTNARLYAPGDIVKLIQSGQVDPWDLTEVPAYYQYDGTNWNRVGIENHAVLINTNVTNNAFKFRKLYQNLVENLDKLTINRIVFTLLYEMLRQNPNCDWFFKTSYIDLHTTQNIPITPYVFPDQATIIKEAVLNLKPFRTKLRDEIATYLAPEEPVNVTIGETEVDRFTLIFDRVACDLTDENSWDTIPWDATATYPETEVITLAFLGNGVQTCFFLPEAVPQDDLFVFVNGNITDPDLDYTFDSVTFELCFNVAPGLGDQISVVIDGPFIYFGSFEYSFQGNNSRNSEIIPIGIAGTHVDSVFSDWNGVHQVPVQDFVLQITSDTEIVYNVTPPTDVVVEGTVFGGVIDDIFIEILYTGDGIQVLFDTTVVGEPLDSVIVSIDGVWQSPDETYAIDDVSSPPNSHVRFLTPPASGAKVSIYAAATGGFVNSHFYNFSGDGSTVIFPVPNLTTLHPPVIFVNLDGIQQKFLSDFNLTDIGVAFVEPPRVGVNIAVFVVINGIGHRLAAGTYPQTIQWDWAFWNYADLGRQEFDFAGFFIGNGITEAFTVPIPQQSSLLYSLVIKYFQNGVAVTLNELGLTMTTTKLATGVVVFLSGPLPSDTYGALYVSRGLFEGLEPTFGFQDPNGVIFTPTPSSYQHFFARLISATFDPSTVMSGCPSHTPEERVQMDVEDLWTIAVKNYVLTDPQFTNIAVAGQAAISGLGSFTFNVPVSHPVLPGQQLHALTGAFTVFNQPPPFPMTGLAGVSHFGVLLANAVATGSDAAIAQTGVFAFHIDDNLIQHGLQAMALVGQIVVHLTDNEPVVGVAATSNHGSFTIQITEHMAGVVATSIAGLFGFQEDTSPGLTGVHATAQQARLIQPEFYNFGLGVTAQVGSLSVLVEHGVKAISHVGILIPRVSPAAFSASATAEVGTIHPSPLRLTIGGQAATAHQGAMSVSVHP